MAIEFLKNEVRPLLIHVLEDVSISMYTRSFRGNVSIEAAEIKGIVLWETTSIITSLGLEYIRNRNNIHKHNKYFLALKITALFVNSIIIKSIYVKIFKPTKSQIIFVNSRINNTTMFYGLYKIFLAWHYASIETMNSFTSIGTMHSFTRHCIRYTDPTKVTLEVNRDDIEQNPIQHAHALCNEIYPLYSKARNQNRQSPFFTTYIHFSGEEGQDAGGLSRDYFNLVFKNVTNNSKDFTIDLENGLASPELQSTETDNVVCQEEDREKYEMLGKLLMMIYHNIMLGGGHNTGVHFSPETFVALEVPIRELSKPYNEVPIELKIQLAHKVLKHDPSYGDHMRNLLEKFFSFLQKTDLWSESEMEEVKQAVEELTSEEGEEVFSMEHGPKKQQKVRELLLEKFPTLPIGKDSRLQPCWYVGQGMRKVASPPNTVDDGPMSWPTDIINFSNTLQGCLNKEAVIHCMNYENCDPGNELINQNIQWLQDWLREASLEQIKKFLVFTTGSPSLPAKEQQTISVCPASFYPLCPIPKSSTCLRKLFISDTPVIWGKCRNDTKEGFNKCLENSLGCTDFGNP